MSCFMFHQTYFYLQLHVTGAGVKHACALQDRCVIVDTLFNTAMHMPANLYLC